MKFAPIQQDFSAGELSERLWGQVASDAYKQGLALAANCLPTQQGSVASRAGGQLLNDGKFTPAPGGSAAVLLPIQDGPTGYGDFQIECRKGSTLIRFLDKFGAIPITGGQDLTLPNPPALYGGQDLTSFFAGLADGDDVWADPVERKLYIRNYDNAVGTPNRSVSLNVDTAQVGTGQMQVSFYYAGTGLIFEQWNGGAMFQAFVVNPGYNSFQFDTANGITLKWSTTLGYGLAAIDIWGLHVASRNAGAGVNYTLNVPGLVVSTGLRAVAFWSSVTETKQTMVDQTTTPLARAPQPIFLVIIVGPGMNPVALTWTARPIQGVTYGIGWNVITVNYEGIWRDPNNDNKWVFTPPWLGSITAIIAYQGRLWFGLNDAYGSLHATKVGYGVLIGPDAFLIQGTPPSPSLRLTFTPGYTSVGMVAQAGQLIFSFVGAATSSDNVRVFKNGVELSNTQFTKSINADQNTNPGGSITLGVGAVAGDIVVVWHGLSPAPAGDALDLKIAQPTGGIAWLAEMRGLLLGTTHDERVFSSGALAIDPVSGSAFEVEKHTTFGSDVTLPALTLHDKVVFALGGRQRIRVMGKSFNTFGGLLAEDLSLRGEHLLRAKIRSMCYLKSPVPRLVFAFDDGTGAVATFNDDKNTLSWARFTIGGPYDVYHVSSLDVPGYPTELWVTSSCGAVFVIRDLDSAVVPRKRKVVPVVPTNQADQIVTYATERTPPVMDGWLVVPAKAGTVYAGLPLAWVGKNIYAVGPDGNLLGTFAAITDGAGGAQITLAAAVATTWTDQGGKLQAAFLTLGVLYPDHRLKTLPLEGGNPAGTAQAFLSRGVQRYFRLVDSYLPLVDGKRIPNERSVTDPMNVLSSRVSGDRRATEAGFERGRQIEISMDLPLRFEVSAIFGGVQSNSV